MTIQSLINLLDVPDTDYWYDSGCKIARTCLDEHQEEFLVIILNEWKKWPEPIQEHLAYILGEGKSHKELEIINALLNSDYDDVVYRAKEAIIEFNQKT